MRTTRIAALALSLAAALAGGRSADAAPVTVQGDAFTAVAQGPTGVQLYNLVAGQLGKIYIGNNSNNATGVPVQVFDPASYSGSLINLGVIGPSVGDADGITGGGGYLYAPDNAEGVRRISMADGSSTLLMSGVAINGAGSPLLYAGGYLYNSFGNGGFARIDQYTLAGAFVRSFHVGTAVETMTYDSTTGSIYYADGPFSTSIVRRLDPSTGVDTVVGSSMVGIDGALYFDALSGLIFAGGANGVNAGSIFTINPLTGQATLFATGGGSGFGGILGIVRSDYDGHLYILDSASSGSRSVLYRLETQEVDEQLGVPEPASLALAGLGVAAFIARRGARALPRTSA